MRKTTYIRWTSVSSLVSALMLVGFLSLGFGKAEAVQTPPPAIVSETGTVSVGGTVVFDVARDAGGCFGVDSVRYSPTATHFLVLANCIEGDNEAFVFRADGSERQAVTAPPADFVSYTSIGWSPDGASLVYQRVNSFGRGPLPGDPTPGIVVFDIATGQKTLILSRAFGQSPAWSPDGSTIAFYTPDVNQGTSTLYLLAVDGSTLWTLDVLPNSTGQGQLAWQALGLNAALLSFVPLNGGERSYLISATPNALAAETPNILPSLEPYQVVDVADDDILNIRSAAGVQNPVVGTIPPYGSGVRITGSGVAVPGSDSPWVPVEYNGITGWVNSHYLASQLAQGNTGSSARRYAWELSPAQANALREGVP